MTVKELREQLSGAPEDAVVQVAGTGEADFVVGFPEMPPHLVLITTENHLIDEGHLDENGNA